MPEADALSPSVPKKGTSSTPLSRRQLRKKEPSKSAAPPLKTPCMSLPLATPNRTVTGASPLRNSHRPGLWGKRLASTKALLAIGSSAACAEAMYYITSFAADLRVQEKTSSLQSSEAIIGEVECRLCAQSVVRLLHLARQEAGSANRVATASTCATCAAMHQLQQPLLTAGLLDALSSLLTVTSECANDTAEARAMARAVRDAVLRTACSITPEIGPPHHVAVSTFSTALSTLLRATTSEAHSLLAARALHSMISGDELTREAVCSTPAALEGLVHASKGTERASVVTVSVRALGALAAREAHDVALTKAGAISALLHALRESARPRTRNDKPQQQDDPQQVSEEDERAKTASVALDALANLADSEIARSVMVDLQAIQLLVPMLVADGPENVKLSAGWIVVSLAVDPNLGERSVQMGALRGIVAYGARESEREREEAAWALANLSAASANATAMSDASVIETLITLARSGRRVPKACMQAVWAMANLAVHSGLKCEFAKRGAVEILLELVRQYLLHIDHEHEHELCEKMVGGGGNPRNDTTASGDGLQCEDDATSEMRELVHHTLQQSMRALANLAGHPENLVRIASGDGLSTVIRAASIKVAELQEVSARCLACLCSEITTAQRFVDLGGMKLLAELLAPEAPGARCVRHEAMLIALNLSTRQPQAVFADAVLGRILRLLTTPEHEPHHFSVEPLALERVANVIANLSAVGPIGKAALLKHNALGHLQALVRRTDVEEHVQETATDVIKQLVTVLTPSSRRALMRSVAPPALSTGAGVVDKRPESCRRRPPCGWEAHGVVPKRSSPLAR